MDDEEFAKIAKEMVLKKEQIKALKNEVEILRSSVLIELKTRDIENISFSNGVKAKYVMQKRNNLDKNALEEYLLEKKLKSLSDFLIESEYELLTVKESE